MSGVVSIRRRWPAAGIAAVAGVGAMLVAAGCSRAPAGPQRYPVSGSVTFAGQPVPAGRIVFEPDRAAGNSGPAAYGSIVAGRFTTYPRMGAVEGPHVVQISGFDGKAFGELSEGRPLFPDHTTSATVPARPATIDFTVPSPAANRGPATAGLAPAAE